MLTMEDTNAIAEDLITGFHQLLEEDRRAVGDFVAAFRLREQFAGLPETNGLTAGLEEVLAGLLSSVFTVSEPKSKAIRSELPKEFELLFDQTVRKLTKKQPAVLLLFKKHLIRRKCNTSQALAALFRKYSDGASVYPY